jgi:bifunctional non-homologous end joining protein LigD
VLSQPLPTCHSTYRGGLLEGIVAKRRDSLYEPGKRTGAWIKYRVNRGQEFVIGGYIPGPHRRMAERPAEGN